MSANNNNNNNNSNRHYVPIGCACITMIGAEPKWQCWKSVLDRPFLLSDIRASSSHARLEVVSFASTSMKLSYRPIDKALHCQ
jgi:hypothetical protein